MRRFTLAFLWAGFLTLTATVAAAQEVEIIHIRLGQGDGTLILGPEADDGSRVSVLIDAGGIPIMGRDAGRIVGAVLHKNGVKELDFIIVTHYDADHIGGIVAGNSDDHGHSFLLGPNNVPGAEGDDDGDGEADWIGSAQTKLMPDADELGLDDDVTVGTFVDRGDVSAPTSIARTKYVNMVTATGAARISLEDQDDVEGFEIDLGDGATMQCLTANGFVRDRSSRVANVNTENERSLCFLLTYGGFHYLTGGDTIGRSFGSENAKVEKAIGEFLVDNEINVDVLHVNHHGGNNASEADFLSLIQPEIAVISLGNDNGHHHPNVNVLKRLIAAGVYRIYQTSWGTTRGSMPEEVRRHQAIFQQDIVIRATESDFEVSTTRTFATDD